MKGFHIVVLLSSAVLLVSAAPALELVTCSKESGAAAARLTMHRINENHGHGYKFRLQEIQGNKVETVDGGCNLELQLNLLETVCHVINPKHFEDCEIRRESARAVMANCTIKMSVRNTDANVTKYECDTRQVKTNREMVRICPDCPTLHPLNSTEGLKSVNEAVSKFNQNTTNQHYYILKEVGRIKVGYIPSVGMAYYAEFALVETHCPTGSRINPEACKPLCPDRAHHAFCKSTYFRSTGLQSVECEFYPPSNTTALGPGEQEPICRHHVGGHPPHVGAGRPPLGPRDGDGHPPHVGNGPPPSGGNGQPSRPCGPRPHGGDGHPPRVGDGHVGRHHAGDGHGDQEKQHHRPPFGSKHHFHAFHHFRHCRGSDPALHPICPWPRPWHRPSPRDKD
ncbi:antihemorrhagic factor BJ46a-like isoform X5 [Sander lucioperca]|uniref:antihemorrhagic factor BJ46a-like isoform X5 n=1 Tax=Sander lucioperca TaxID=283035 RepID=UPI00125DD824|nr:antihemorrhagic factor BJ46a-like isoform X5 [Sander lucioperca]